jgi:hypothetical protein
MRDERRLNVALSRTWDQLIICGDRRFWEDKIGEAPLLGYLARRRMRLLAPAHQLKVE